jgi:hypothetical protein
MSDTAVLFVAMMGSMACVASIGSAGVGLFAYLTGFVPTGEEQVQQASTCNPGGDDAYEFKRREQKDGNWVCPDGWSDTGCGWSDGSVLGEKQCQKAK